MWQDQVRKELEYHALGSIQFTPILRQDIGDMYRKVHTPELQNLLFEKGEFVLRGLVKAGYAKMYIWTACPYQKSLHPLNVKDENDHKRFVYICVIFTLSRSSSSPQLDGFLQPPLKTASAVPPIKNSSSSSEKKASVELTGGSTCQAFPYPHSAATKGKSLQQKGDN